MLIQSKPLITTLVIFFTSTAVAITGLVISNSGKIPSPENLENVSLEDVIEDTVINTKEIIPVQKPAEPKTSKVVQPSNSNQWWKRSGTSATTNKTDLNTLQQQLCGFLAFSKRTEIQNTCSESTQT